MIINDTDTIVRKEAMAKMEEGREKFLLSCENEVRDRHHAPRMSDITQRMGRPLLPAQLEERLKRLNADLFFEVIPENPTHKRVSLVDQRGKYFIAVYENSLMPERSIAKTRILEVPDPSFTHADRKDFDSAPDSLKPGWRRVEVPWGEARRGWRTILVRLIQAGAITLTQAEDEFGADVTPEWAQHTGKGEFTTPF